MVVEAGYPIIYRMGLYTSVVGSETIILQFMGRLRFCLLVVKRKSRENLTQLQLLYHPCMVYIYLHFNMKINDSCRYIYTSTSPMDGMGLILYVSNCPLLFEKAFLQICPRIPDMTVVIVAPKNLPTKTSRNDILERMSR